MNTNKGAISGLNPDLSQGTLKYISQNTLGVALHRDQRENMDFRKNYYKKQWEQNTELQHVSFRLCCSLIQSCLTSYNLMKCSMPGFPVLHYLPEIAQTRLCWVDDAIQPSHLLLPPSPLAFNLSQNQGLFQWVELALHVRWPKYWSFSLSASNEYSGLISFRMDWLDLLAVQGTHRSLLQHHSSKASILWRSAFSMVQLSSWLLENHSIGYMDLCQQSDISAF